MFRKQTQSEAILGKLRNMRGKVVGVRKTRKKREIKLNLQLQIYIGEGRDGRNQKINKIQMYGMELKYTHNTGSRGRIDNEKCATQYAGIMKRGERHDFYYRQGVQRKVRNEAEQKLS